MCSFAWRAPVGMIPFQSALRMRGLFNDCRRKDSTRNKFQSALRMRGLFNKVSGNVRNGLSTFQSALRMRGLFNTLPAPGDSMRRMFQSALRMRGLFNPRLRAVPVALA